MDETTKVQQGDTSEGQGGNTPEQETPTFTKKQADALVVKARSDALAEVGRLKKAADDANRIAQDVLKRLQTREQEDMRREEEAAKDDPEKLSALQMRRQAQQEKIAVEEDRRRVEADRTEIQTQRQEILEHRAERLAEKYNADAALLLKYGGSSKESMEELAKSFGERTSTGESPKGRMTTSPDSGKTKGSGTARKPTLAEIKAATPAEFDKKIKSGEWLV